MRGTDSSGNRGGPDRSGRQRANPPAGGLGSSAQTAHNRDDDADADEEEPGYGGERNDGEEDREEEVGEEEVRLQVRQERRSRRKGNGYPSDR